MRRNKKKRRGPNELKCLLLAARNGLLHNSDMVAAARRIEAVSFICRKIARRIVRRTPWTTAAFDGADTPCSVDWRKLR